MKTLATLLLIAALPTLAACSASEAQPQDVREAERGPLGKADNAGSCEAVSGEALCGGAGTGSCYCDELCHDYGDCCADKVDVCDGEAPSGAQLCMSDNQCDDGQACDHTECLSNCEPGQICPAVCFGQCAAAEADGQVGDPCSLFAAQCADGLVCEFVCPFEADPCPNFGINPSGFCAEPSTEPEPEPEPPAAPSCAGECGGAAPGNACYCDDLCEGYGDCCEDYAAVC